MKIILILSQKNLSRQKVKLGTFRWWMKYTINIIQIVEQLDVIQEVVLAEASKLNELEMSKKYGDQLANVLYRKKALEK